MAALVADPASSGGHPGDRLPEDLLDEAAAVIRRVAAGLRDDRRRHQALNGGLPEPRAASDTTGAQVRAARALVGLSQRELGQDLGFSRGIVADAELGRRSCPPLLSSWALRILKGGA